ncbi:MAG: class I SAM-dependent methyltransferase [Thermoplasmata archaeon]|nr:class I SAM-dependent methyltransferase [Thermoplasmata archaeon]
MLKKHQDAFGRGIYDYYHGEHVDEVIERDDGYIDVSDGPVSYLAKFEDWPQHQQRAIRHSKGRVLDIGCGGGRHSLYLQNQGMDVLGIDNSPFALKTCQERGLKKSKLMDITQITKKLGTFDTIVMMGNNFGLFTNPKRAKWLLRKFRNMTSPDAYIIAETMDIYQTEAKHHLDYQAWNRKRGRMSGQVKIRVRYLNYCTPWLDYLMVSKPELETILEGTGWKAKKYINGKSGIYCMILEKEA